METILRNFIIPALMFSVTFMSSLLYAQKSDEWKAPASAKDKKNPFPLNEVSIRAGKNSYIMECSSCHGKKGKGDGPNAESLAKHPANLVSEKVQAQTDGELFWKISEGKEHMPFNKKILSVDQRWEVINYLRSLLKEEK